MASGSSGTKARGGSRASGDKCASDGCGHPRSEHNDNGSSCWGDSPNCPCTRFVHDKAELEVLERTTTGQDADGGSAANAV